MGNIPNSLMYLLLFWGAVTAVLLALVAYRAILSRTEDDSIYLDKAEEMLMVGERGRVVTVNLDRDGSLEDFGA